MYMILNVLTYSDIIEIKLVCPSQEATPKNFPEAMQIT